MIPFQEPVKHTAAFVVKLDEVLRDRLLMSLEGQGNNVSIDALKCTTVPSS